MAAKVAPWWAAVVGPGPLDVVIGPYPRWLALEREGMEGSMVASPDASWVKELGGVWKVSTGG